MQVQRIKEGFLVLSIGSAESIGGGEPLLDFGLFTVGVSDAFERRHCSAECRCEPSGAGENSSGKQFDGLESVLFEIVWRGQSGIGV